MARDLGCEMKDLLRDEGLRKRIDLNHYLTDTVGLPTLTDILQELAKPGRDPRQQFESVGFAEGVMKISDLQPGMTLSGVITNVTAFGAFVDMGVHQDGLVHVSELADGFVKDPHAVVKVNQHVNVRVLAVDLERNRISLSMRQPSNRVEEKKERKPRGKKPLAAPPSEKKPKPGPFNNPFASAFRK
jgi:uncharacterized protein